jgi:electron transfer flavoprotein alpha subunit
MKILALDLSTKPGYAVFEYEKLGAFGTFFAEKKAKDYGDYPFSYVKLAQETVRKVMTDLIQVHDPDAIIIEETTLGRNSLSQKILEFIHFELLREINLMPLRPEVYYIRTGEWRNVVGCKQNDEEKKLNKEIKKIKKKTGKTLAKIDGKVVGRITKKHVALRVFYEKFGVELPIKMEDAADAALVGLAFLKGAETCDGTNKTKRKAKG